MKNQLSSNYTGICWYCGVVYKSNRSTSKYCCSKHNSLYARNGPCIKPYMNRNGEIMDYDPILENIYSEMGIFYEDGWGVAYSYRAIREDFEYTGPLPTGNELLLVGSYLIGADLNQAIDTGHVYFVKPFTQLTVKEKLASIIKRQEHEHEASL